MSENQQSETLGGVLAAFAAATNRAQYEAAKVRGSALPAADQFEVIDAAIAAANRLGLNKRRVKAVRA